MLNKLLSLLLFTAIATSSSIFYFQRSTIKDLHDDLDKKTKSLNAKSQQVSSLEMSLEQQNQTIEIMHLDAKKLEAVISNHQNQQQIERSSHQSTELKINRIIDNDKSANEWADTPLPADIKRLFNCSTRERNNHSHKVCE